MYDGFKIWVKTIGGDLDHFLVMMGSQQGSTLSPFLFALIVNEMTCHIQCEALWYIFFADNIILIDETCDEVKERFKASRQTLKSKGFRLSRTIIKYMELCLVM